MRRLLALLFKLFCFGCHTQAQPLNIVTYNIRYDASSDVGERDWSQRKIKVSKFLQDSKANIIGLQEVLHGQLVDLKKSMPTFHHLGTGRNGKTKGEYSPIFYNPEIWTLDKEENGTFWLSDTPQTPGSATWGNTLARICTYARFTDKSGKGIYVFNTHFDNKSQNSREKAAELILKKISLRKHQDEPVILMGDFNATIEDQVIKTLLESPLLIDNCKQHVSTFNSWKPGLRPGFRIDHIFNSPSLKNITVKVLEDGNPTASDHHPMQLLQTP